jgi:signal transduction histidine kinase
MSTRSLFVRLVASATILIILALTLATIGLRAIFNQEIERRAADELTQIVKTIAAQVRIDVDGSPVLDVALPDPRFDAPYGGIYWQVSRSDGRSARSRSLWDYTLKEAYDGPTGEKRLPDLVGPNGSTLLAVARRISVASPTGDDVALNIVAALDRTDIAASQRSVLHLLILSLATLGLILVVAMAFFIRLALRPFGALRRGLQAIHGGTSDVLSGDFPDEVQNVVDDLNRLVAFQHLALDRAKTQAGDLAHGLKTPLAVLSAVGRQAATEGRAHLADPIEEQVAQMRRQVDRVLARARAGGVVALGRRVVVTPTAQKVVRAFERLPDAEALTWECRVSHDATFPGDEGDLTEMLGNLLDNARKWAKTRVRLVVTTTPAMLTLKIEDDGPGLPTERASQITRGRRWDEEQPGTGFGLAITQELAQGYQGTLELGRSELGGLSAIVMIPLPGSRRGTGPESRH